MQKIILQPTASKDAQEHYEKTIENTINLGDIETFLSEDEFNKLQSLYSNGEARIWGVQAGNNGFNVSRWNKIEAGDITLFSAKKTIFSSATTVYKSHNEELANYLWGRDDEGNTWEYLYFINEVTHQNISYLQFNESVGYKDNYIIQGFNVLDVEKSSKVFDKFGVDSEVYYPEITKEEFELEIDKLMDHESLDREVTSLARVEQSRLRNYLFKNKPIGTCGICNKVYPVNFLVAAHIKKRSLCSREERLDYENIVMPMCKFGCDDLYEKKYIYINDDGIISININNIDTIPLNKYLADLDGEKCKLFSESNKQYFKYHRGNK